MEGLPMMSNVTFVSFFEGTDAINIGYGRGEFK